MPMTTRKQWKQMGFTAIGFEVKQGDDGRWSAKAVGKNDRGRQGIYLIATKDRQASHGSEYEALASMMEWVHT